MARISTQSALQALHVMHNAKEIRVTSSGKVRAATIFDRAASKLHQQLYSTANPTDWESKAKVAVLNKLFNEIGLLKKSISDKDKEKLESIIFNVNVKKEASNPETWRTTLSSEINYLIKDSNFKDLAQALWKLEKIDRTYPPKVEHYIQNYLSENTVSTTENGELRGISKYLQAEKKLSLADANTAAKKIIKAVDRYGIDFEKAIQIFSLQTSKKNLLNTSDKKEKNNEDIDSSNEELINDLSIYLEKKYGLPKELTSKSAERIDRIMARYGVDIPNALDFSNFVGKMVEADLIEKSGNINEVDLDTAKVVQHVMKRDGISMTNALQVANRRSAALPMLEAALPPHFKLNIVDNVISGLTTTLSSDVVNRMKERLTTLSNLEVTEYTLTNGNKYKLSKQHLLDTKREFNCTFNNCGNITNTEDAKQEKRTQYLIKIAKTPMGAESLSKILNQALLAELERSILMEDAQTKKGETLRLDPKGNTKLQTKRTEYYVSRNGTDNKITVRAVHFESKSAIVDISDNDRSWPINSGNIWDNDIDKANFGSAYEMSFDLKDSDLEQGIINPVFVRQPGYSFRIGPNWDEIDVILAAESVKH